MSRADTLADIRGYFLGIFKQSSVFFAFGNRHLDLPKRKKITVSSYDTAGVQDQRARRNKKHYILS
jgi:hypothetical protein